MSALSEAIKKVASGPHLSKDLSAQEAYDVLTEILSGQVEPVQAAVFFIALRMKRETNEENLGLLRALQAATTQYQAQVDQLLLLADPFNGFNRYCPVSVFIPAVLAAAGLPAVAQGVSKMGPKFGVTHAQVLELAGYTWHSSEAAAQAVSQPDIGWAYLDQAQATPSLYALQGLRTLMIKRPSLASLEKMLRPVVAQQQTHLAIGFVHKAYPAILGWLAQQTQFASALILRGQEGGIVPTLRAPSTNFRLIDGELNEVILNPEDFAIEQNTRGVIAEDNIVTASRTLELGLNALAGQQGSSFDSLVYGAAALLWHCRYYDSQQQAADKIRQVIKSGKAKAHFDAGVSQ